MKKKLIVTTVIIVLLILTGIFYFRYYFVFGEGIKAGELNRIVKKGYVFKTYEGKLIQSGIRNTATGIQSNEFEFSVEDEAIADSLMRCGGLEVELRYKEYKHPILWRGMSEFVVDEIISVRKPQTSFIK